MEKRVFRRKIYNAIGEWKRKSNGQTALLIEGARRIGKSTIVEKFAQEEYRSYILIKDRYLIYTKDLAQEEETLYVPAYMTPLL